MNNFISLNISFLCESERLTQKEFGEIFGLKQNVISSYMKNNATPKLETIQEICTHFNVSLDDFINRDLRNVQKVVPGDYYKDPLIGLLATEPAGSMQAAGYVNMIQELRGRIADKDEMIQMLKAEIVRLKGETNYKDKTA